MLKVYQQMIHMAQSLDLIPRQMIGVWTRSVSTRFSRLSMESSRLTRDETAETVSRD